MIDENGLLIPDIEHKPLTCELCGEEISDLEAVKNHDLCDECFKKECT